MLKDDVGFSILKVSFVSPFTLFILLFLFALFIRVYQYRYRLFEAFHQDIIDVIGTNVAIIWDTVVWIWHGYEIIGFENIPESRKTAALIVFYHGTLPIDYYCIFSQTILLKKRYIKTVGDHFLFKIPVLNFWLTTFHVFPGSSPLCVQYLKEGHLVAISPGGVLEAQFGDEDYRLVWANRIGFAKVAIEAQVPIIPVFTENVRETFRTIKTGKSWLRKVYDKTRLPVVPIYGWFPVKMRSYIGTPIPYDPNITPEELAKKTAAAIEKMTITHQRIPGNIFEALIDRIYEKSKLKSS